MTKADFIRKHPNKRPAVVATLAAHDGISFSPSYVSYIRSTDKAKAGAPRRTYARRSQSVDPLRAAVERFARQIIDITRADMAKRLGEMMGG